MPEQELDGQWEIGQIEEFDAFRKKLAVKLRGISASDWERIRQAFLFAEQAHRGQKRAGGAPFITHPIEVALTLTELNPDVPTIMATLLHDVVEDTDVTLAEINAKFGHDIAYLVDGVTKITVAGREEEHKEQAKVDTIRKLIVNASGDMRILIIKLADRLHNMRQLSALPEKKQKRIATETLEIYAPLAHRLGLGVFRWKLEDLAFRHLYPKEYRDIEKRLVIKRRERQKILAMMQRDLNRELIHAGISCEVQVRVKHIYSIYKKIKIRGIPFEEIADLQAMRIITNTVDECYQVLGIVHKLWRPDALKLNDYIANPKENLYQSLHTTVRSSYGEKVEIQIRTKKMHTIAEYGVAAHWAYKGRDLDFKLVNNEEPNQITRIADLFDEDDDTIAFINELKDDLQQDKIRVLTPKNEEKFLPKGSTILDFAFSIHSEIGFHCSGARMNGRLVPPDTILKENAVIEIITSPNQFPNADWKKMVHTHRAKNSINRYIRNLNDEILIESGIRMMRVHLAQIGLNYDDIDLDEKAHQIGLANASELLLKLAKEEVVFEDIINENLESFALDEKTKQLKEAVKLGDWKFCTACCPFPNDEILIRFDTVSEWVVHRNLCSALQKDKHPLVFPANWSNDADKFSYLVRLLILTNRDCSYLAELGHALEQYNAKLDTLKYSPSGKLDYIAITCRVKGTKNLENMLSTLRTIPCIKQIERSMDESCTMFYQ